MNAPKFEIYLRTNKPYKQAARGQEQIEFLTTFTSEATLKNI